MLAEWTPILSGAIPSFEMFMMAWEQLSEKHPRWYALHRDECESAQNTKQGSSALGKTLKHLTLTH